MNFNRSSLTWVSFHGIGHLRADTLPCVTHVPGPFCKECARSGPTPTLSWKERDPEFQPLPPILSLQFSGETESGEGG